LISDQGTRASLSINYAFNCLIELDDGTKTTVSDTRIDLCGNVGVFPEQQPYLLLSNVGGFYGIGKPSGSQGFPAIRHSPWLMNCHDSVSTLEQELSCGHLQGRGFPFTFKGGWGYWRAGMALHPLPQGLCLTPS